MGLFASLRNAVNWAAFDLGRLDGASAQAVVIVDPASGLPASSSGVLDSTGQAFDPASCSHVYGYTDGQMTTDTATLSGVSWVKTYTYDAGGSLTAESRWVRQ